MINLTDRAGVPQNGKGYHKVGPDRNTNPPMHVKTLCHFGWDIQHGTYGLILTVEELHRRGYYPCSKCYYPGERESVYKALGEFELPYPRMTVQKREKAMAGE